MPTIGPDRSRDGYRDAAASDLFPDFQFPNLHGGTDRISVTHINAIHAAVEHTINEPKHRDDSKLPDHYAIGRYPGWKYDYSSARKWTYSALNPSARHRADV